MRYLLDTCIVSLFARGHERVLEEIKRRAPSDIAVSAVTDIEIQYGIVLDPQRATKLSPVLDAS